MPLSPGGGQYAFAPPKPKPPPIAAPARPRPPSGGGGGSGAAPKPQGKGASYPIGSYTSWTGDPTKGAVPAGEYNVLESLMGEWESLVGFSIEPSDAQLLAMANGGIQTLRDFGQFMSTQTNGQAASKTMPWAKYGLTKDEYSSAANTYGTEYKKITGQDISPDALQQAFQNPRDPTGGLLNTSQYAQQLMNDAAIQKQYGWVKYGYDYSAWTQQKLSMRSSYGRDINDAEAATILQYNKQASGANMGAVARAAGQQQEKPSGAGVAQSVAR